MPLARLCIAAALGLIALHAVAQDIQLAPEEVRTTITNKKLFTRVASGGLVDVSFLADGSATVSTPTVNDSGNWRLTETGYCATWKRLRDGKEGCFTMVRRGGSLFVLNLDGTLSAQILRIVD